MHSDHFSWKSKQLLPPCTYHTCEIATCRLKLWAPLVASNTNDDDNDDDNNNNNTNNYFNNNANSLPRIVMTTNIQSGGICSVNYY